MSPDPSTDSDFSAWQDVASATTITLTHTVTGLTDGTSYQFKVRAVNATGNGATSEASTAVAPTDESLMASTVESTTATLTIANYSGSWYYKATAPSESTCSAEIATGTAIANLTGLSTNTSYTYKAYSDSSCTDANELAVTSDFLTRPGQPTTPMVEAGAGSGKLTLSASVTGDGAITGWQLQQKASTDSDFGAWQDVASATTITLTHTVTGLTDGTSYQFKVRTVNATGTGAASDTSTAVAPTDESLTARTVEATTATLTIANYSDSWYYKATAPSESTCSAEIAADADTADLTGLSTNTSYTFKAYSDSSCTTANELAAVTFLTRPGQPTKPVATVGDSKDSLKLTASVAGAGAIRAGGKSSRKKATATSVPGRIYPPHPCPPQR